MGDLIWLKRFWLDDGITLYKYNNIALISIENLWLFIVDISRLKEIFRIEIGSFLNLSTIKQDESNIDAIFEP